MDDCIFCKIVRKEIPKDILYEDEHSVAFLDIHPNNPGHTLVIPRDHFENIYTIPDEELCRLMLDVKKIAIAVKHATDADGITIGINNEKSADQEVMHLHIHIIPRFVDDGFQHGRHLPYKEGEEKEVAEKIRSQLVI